MAQNLTQRSFRSGEWNPSLHARIDLRSYAEALATCYNFYVLPEGGAANRPGFEYVDATKYHDKRSRLKQFQFSVVETYMLEFGERYIRFYRNGGRIILPEDPAAWASGADYAAGNYASDAGVHYYCKVSHTAAGSNQPGAGGNWTDYWHALTDSVVEIPTPYVADDLPLLKFTQSADVLSIFHPAYPPRELARTDHHVWTLTDMVFEPQIATPTGLSVTTETVGTGSTERAYRVTAVSAQTGEESLASTTATVETDTDGNWIEGEYIELGWTAVSGASRYNVYKNKNGVYGYIGTTTETTFTDDKIAPDLIDTAPPQTARMPFSGEDEYPGVGEYFEQRFVFGRTNNAPQTIHTSQSGQFQNMNISEPAKDDDAITFTLAGRKVNEIRALVGLSDLIVMTSGAEWRIKGPDGYLKATQPPDAKAQSHHGSSHVPPLVVANTVLFVQTSGSIVRDLGYAFDVDGYKGFERSATAKHLLLNKQITEWCYAQAPDSVIWAIRNDGVLLSLTYQDEHEVYGWSWHETDGEFESIESVREGNEDAVYAVVKRTIGGETKRYIERLHTRRFENAIDAFFVDSGLTYDAGDVSYLVTENGEILSTEDAASLAPESTTSMISVVDAVESLTLNGLDHLEGKTVSILADGNVKPPQVVTNGAVTITPSASVVHVGLPYTGRLKTMPIDTGQGQRGKKMLAGSVYIDLLDSRGLWAAPGDDESRAVEYKQRTNENYDEETRLKTGRIHIALNADWEQNGVVTVLQRDPLPVTVLAITPEVEYGA